MALTRGEIINEGLEYGGNPGLTVRARIFLRLFEGALYSSHIFHELEREATLTLSSGSATYDIDGNYPDFRVAVEALIRKSTDKGFSRLVYSDKRSLFQAIKTNALNTTSNGQPTHFTFNRRTDNFEFYPTPDQAYTVELLYIARPELPLSAVTDLGSAASTTGGSLTSSATYNWGMTRVDPLTGEETACDNDNSITLGVSDTRVQLTAPSDSYYTYNKYFDDTSAGGGTRRLVASGVAAGTVTTVDNVTASTDTAQPTPETVFDNTYPLLNSDALDIALVNAVAGFAERWDKEETVIISRQDFNRQIAAVVDELEASEVLHNPGKLKLDDVTFNKPTMQRPKR